MEFFKSQKQPTEMERVMANLTQAENDMFQKINQLGQLYYENHKNDTDGLDEEYASLIKTIIKLDENRKGFFNYKLRLEGAMLCVNCTSAIPYGSVYCPICGKKSMEKEEGTIGEDTSIGDVCNKCGKTNPPNSAFCAECGNKLN